MSAEDGKLSRRDFLKFASGAVAYTALFPVARPFSSPEQQRQQMVQWELPMYPLSPAELEALTGQDRKLIYLALRRNETTSQLEAVLPLANVPGHNNVYTESNQLYREQVNVGGSRAVAEIPPASELTYGIGSHLEAIENYLHLDDSSKQTHEGAELTLAVRDGQAGAVVWTKESARLDGITLPQGSAMVFDRDGNLSAYLGRQEIPDSEVVVTEFGQPLADWLRINHGIDTDAYATTIVQRDSLSYRPYVILLEGSAFVIPLQWYADNEGRSVNLRSKPTTVEDNIVGQANLNVAVTAQEANVEMLAGADGYYFENNTVKVQKESYVWMLVWADKAHGKFAWVATNEGFAPARFGMNPSLPPTQEPYNRVEVSELTVSNIPESIRSSYPAEIVNNYPWSDEHDGFVRTGPDGNLQVWRSVYLPRINLTPESIEECWQDVTSKLTLGNKWNLQTEMNRVAMSSESKVKSAARIANIEWESPNMWGAALEQFLNRYEDRLPHDISVVFLRDTAQTSWRYESPMRTVFISDDSDSKWGVGDEIIQNNSGAPERLVLYVYDSAKSDKVEPYYASTLLHALYYATRGDDERYKLAAVFNFVEKNGSITGEVKPELLALIRNIGIFKEENRMLRVTLAN